MAGSTNIYHRYFIFSKQQMDTMIDIQKKRGGVAPVFGKVIIKGVPKMYTDIVADPNNIRYSDAKILVSGDIRTIKYTKSNIK